MEVGYLPDMFGHVAQMPQILRQAGFDARRGLARRAVGGRPHRLHLGGTRRLDRAGRVPARSATATAPPCPTTPRPSSAGPPTTIDEVGPFLHRRDLLLHERHGPPARPSPGSDGWSPRRTTSRTTTTSRSPRSPSTSPPRPTRAWRTWQGELRSGSRANLLMGVTSNRVDVKRPAAAAERDARAAGRAAAPPCSGRPAAWPGRLLELAWLEVVRNSAHDSICACSVDDVVDAVLHRYAEARQIADGLADRALERLRPLAGRARARACVNPSPAPRLGRGRAGRRGRRSRAAPTSRCSPSAAGPARVDDPRRQHGAHRARHAAGAQDRRRRLGARRPDRGRRRGHRHHGRRSAPRSGPTSPSPRPSRTSTPGSGRTPTPWSASASTSRRSGAIVARVGRGPRVRVGAFEPAPLAHPVEP